MTDILQNSSLNNLQTLDLLLMDGMAQAIVHLEKNGPEGFEEERALKAHELLNQAQQRDDLAGPALQGKCA